MSQYVCELDLSLPVKDGLRSCREAAARLSLGVLDEGKAWLSCEANLSPLSTKCIVRVEFTLWPTRPGVTRVMIEVKLYGPSGPEEEALVQKLGHDLTYEIQGTGTTSVVPAEEGARREGDDHDVNVKDTVMQSGSSQEPSEDRPAVNGERDTPSAPRGRRTDRGTMPSANWRTARVFISSTFRDMHAERDYLVRAVFPELQERCAKRRLHLSDIDLRWGVTEEEAEQGKVLEIILEEVDHSRPFFVAILGERYGFIPTSIPEDTQFTHSWLKDFQGYSLTSLEIIHGVLRNPDTAKRSFFYFRDPQFTAQVPQSNRADYLPESFEASNKLADLKARIRASGRPVMENYPCRWDNAQGRVVDLDILGQRVLEDLWTAICAEYPEDAPEADPLDVERRMHETFAEERSRLHVGRIDQARRLTEYVQGKDRPPLVVTGESGCGKSAFLANCYRRHTTENPGDFVLAYFIGASPDSTNHIRLLRNMCLELKRKFDLKEDIPEDDKNLSETLGVLLSSAAQGKARIVIMLDALDQLSPLGGAHGLGWLLDYIPENARLVASSLEGECLEVLRRREAEEIALPPLSAGEQRQIISTLLGEWRRKLDERQMTALLAHPGVKNALYLRVALEELKLFGIFEELTERIRSLADDIPGLFDQVLDRLESDHGRELVTEAFSLLYCSRYGLSETELLDLLTTKSGERLPRALWARLARSAGAYLVQRGELLGFFHRQIADAVASRYKNIKHKHTKLAAYFEYAPIERKLEEYPYQLQYAEQWEALATALSNLDFFDYAFEHDRKYEWMGYWRSIEGRFEPGVLYRHALEEKGEVEGRTNAVAYSLNQVGAFLWEMGLYNEAEPLIRQALEISEKALGPNHPSTPASVNNLAALYQSQGRYNEAEPLYKRALEICEEALGPNHPHTASSLNNLASLYNEQGRYSEAEPLYKRALEIREKVLGPNHRDTAQSLSNLAGLYVRQGRYNEAEMLYKLALEMRERVLGASHPDTAQSLSNLAVLYNSQGRYNEAEPLYKRTLEIREKALGPSHPSTAMSLSNLAVLHVNQGRYNEAEPLYKRALEIRERLLGASHPDTAQSLSNLAVLYNSQRRYNEAEPLHKRALEIREKALGASHPDTALSLNNLAGLYNDQRRYNEAEPLFRRALEIREKTLGPDHPDTAQSLNSLAGLYNDQGRYNEAEPLFKRALEIREKALGPNHPDTAQSLNYLALIYANQGRYKEAEPLFKQALVIREEALGTNHPDTAQSLNNLAGLYYRQRRYKEAESLCKRALEITEKTLGHDHPGTATFLNKLALLHANQGKYNEAEPLYKRVLEISEKALGPNHPNTKVSRENLEKCQEAMRRR